VNQSDEIAAIIRDGKRLNELIAELRNMLMRKNTTLEGYEIAVTLHLAVKVKNELLKKYYEIRNRKN
jgi:hypothetical protein